jgi:DHA1 family multidrug resistance protein-like MFS transporter
MNNTDSTNYSEKDSLNSNAAASPVNDDPSVEAFLPTNEDSDLEAGAANDLDDSDDAKLMRVETSSRLSRELSRKLTGADAIHMDESTPIPRMGKDRDYPPMLPDPSDYTVAFDGTDDPLHPHNWSLKKKITQCSIIGFNTFCIAFGSAIFAQAVLPLAAIYHVHYVVTTLSITLYVLGFATGPIVWAPLSELFGRRPVLVISSLAFCCFNFAVAVSDRLESIMICRFFAGCLGAAPLVVVPASFADMFGNESRGTAIVVFSMCVFVGPLVAPFIGGFIVANHSLGWRWTEFITGILAAASFVTIILFEVETHHPIILVEKAREIRRRTGIWGIHAPHDEFTLSIKEIVENNLTRPIKMLFQEPILFFITLYNAFIYGMIYLFLEAYPIVFAEGYGMKPGVAELPYFGLVIGQFFGGFFCIWSEKAYNRKMKESGGKIIPENRLPPMIVGSFAFPIGLLWFCWSGNYPDKVHWMVPTVSGLFTGFGLITIFNPSMNYIIDAYLVFAASAMAANSVLRSTFGAVFPLFATFMFKNMGTNWAGLLLGLFAVVLIACPLAFAKWGKQLRQKSKYAFDLS